MIKLTYALFLLFIGAFSFSQTEFNTCGNNKITNSTFDTAPNGATTINGWTFTPTGDPETGWLKKNTFTYGSNLFIDRIGTHVASADGLTVCAGGGNVYGGAKVLRFRFNTSNTGAFTFQAKIGNQVVATFTEDGGFARSQLITPSNVEANVFREILSTKYIDPQTGQTYRAIANNIWHDIEIYIPNFTGITGDLTFTYERLAGVSRQVMLDNVELYDALPKPVLTQESVGLTCTEENFDLNTILNEGAYDASNGYVYEWSTSQDFSNTLTSGEVAAAGLGKYYVRISESSCTGTQCTGPIATFEVKSDCCGTKNEITNSDFIDTTPQDDVPDNWEYDGGSSFFSLRTGQLAFDRSAASGIPLPNVTTNYLHYYSGGAVGRVKQNLNICQNDGLNFSFDLAAFNVGGQYTFRIIYNTTGSSANQDYFRIRAKDNNNDMELLNLPNDIEVSWQGVTDPSFSGSYTSTQNNDSHIIPYAQLQMVRYTFKIPKVEDDIEKIGFDVRAYNEWIFGNVSAIVMPPEADSPTVANASINCITGSFDLTSLEPTDPTITKNHRYEWYDGSVPSTANKIDDPTSVSEAGTYYMLTISTCSGCLSEDTMPVNLTSVCPTVSGSIYVDYDGKDIGGISNAGGITADTTNGGGLYAILVNGNGNVAASVPVNNDGTYLINAVAGSNYYVAIHNENLTVGTAAPTTFALNTNWDSTGEAISGSIDSTVNAQSATFDLVASQDKSNVDFGIQYKPVSNSSWSAICNNGGATVQVPEITGLDDDPNFLDTYQPKMTIGTITTNNGTLQYDGSLLTNNAVISAYDPAKLEFTPTDGTEQASVSFDYKFTDSAGAESIEAGEVNFRINKAVDATITASAVTYCPTSSDPVPTIKFTGLNGFSPYTFTYSINNGTSQTTTTATGVDELILTQQNTTVGTYVYKLISVEDAIGCSVSFTDKEITVYVGCDDTDGDGIIDVAEGSTSSTPVDTDGDGTPDYQDLDSDNDGILDSVESNTDTDGDGIPNFRDLDSDNDGNLDVNEGGNGALDTNNDGVIDSNDVGYQDTSPADGVVDGTLVDALTLDADSDGIPDFLDPNDNENNDENNGGVSPTYLSGEDSDEDGILDIHDSKDGFGLRSICYKDPTSVGTPEQTYVGISTLDRNVESNWVSDTKSGFIKLESKSKGFVITRLSNNQIANITDPKEGMLVWSLTDQCLKMNIDGTTTGWTCIKQGCNH